MQPDVTRPQLVLVGLVSGLALLLGLTWPGSRVNMAIAAHEVVSAIMPPGMLMTTDTSAEAMRDMVAFDPRTFRFRAPVDAQGDQRLTPAGPGDAMQFAFTLSAGQWHILKGRSVWAYAINGRMPGPAWN
ncbi:hypothetical protein HNQ07_003992 [Deinococcus metalli]|uniref:Uncharacterized protein n=1 Tax=Deinococcus metalli TaxID=1141878 RepID=A0A7W8NS26_9DEIO|nr:hypothetical protein [Deinococcus metalli]MBB5378485.1 hypothetical protein [Deinococcus metalli]GHF58059.1 hypothetical protein GCM10017781_37850 [Deinococcus metalli]